MIKATWNSASKMDSLNKGIAIVLLVLTVGCFWSWAHRLISDIEAAVGQVIFLAASLINRYVFGKRAYKLMFEPLGVDGNRRDFP